MAQNNSTALARRGDAAVTRWSPWAEMERVEREMDGLFGRMFGFTTPSRLIPPTPGAPWGGDAILSPDIYETDEELVFVLPLPGVAPDALNVEATDRTLTIRGERKPFYENEHASQVRRSWWSSAQGAFEARYDLPNEIDPSRVQASFRHGVLELHLPRPEAARPKSVRVEVQSA